MARPILSVAAWGGDVCCNLGGLLCNLRVVVLRGGLIAPILALSGQFRLELDMNVTIHEDKTLHDIKVDIACPLIDSKVTRIVASLNAFDIKLTGSFDQQTFIIDPHDAYYIETVDRKTFIYTENKVYESPLRLYELKDLLTGTEFIQVSKQTIVNFDKVIALEPYFNARMILTLANKESVIVSRQFTPDIKKKLGIR